jgi:hypothetical protein
VAGADSRQGRHRRKDHWAREEESEKPCCRGITHGSFESMSDLFGVSPTQIRTESGKVAKVVKKIDRGMWTGSCPRFVRSQPTVDRFDESLRNVQLDGGQQNPSGAELAIWQCLWVAYAPAVWPLSPVNAAFVFTKSAERIPKSELFGSADVFELNRPNRTWGALKRRRDSIFSSRLRFWKAGGSAPAQDLVRLTTPGRALRARLSLSHSRRRRASWRQIGH